MPRINEERVRASITPDTPLIGSMYRLERNGETLYCAVGKLADDADALVLDRLNTVRINWPRMMQYYEADSDVFSRIMRVNDGAVNLQTTPSSLRARRVLEDLFPEGDNS